MVRAGEFNFHVDPVRTEITGTQQIPISGKSKGIIVDKNLLQVCSTDES